MNMKQKLLLGITAVVLTTSNVWAKDKGERGSGHNDRGHIRKIKSNEGPEIDAATATIPIALLTGIVLLMKERTRSSRYSKSEE